MKNYKNFWKRGISLALALMMCLSLLPVNVFAAPAETHDHTTLAAAPETCEHLNKTRQNKGGFLVTWYRETCTDCGEFRWIGQGWITERWYEGKWGSNEKPEVDEKCGHENTEVRGAKDATCAEEGYTGDTYCLGCDAKIEDGVVIPATGAHNPEGNWSHDADTHWHECLTCGAKLDDAAHVFTGYAWDGTEWVGTCACGAEDHKAALPGGADHEHVYSETWTSSSEGHWHQCECGAKESDPAAHDYAFVATDSEISHEKKCSVCGYVAGRIAHNFSATTSSEVKGGKLYVYSTCESCGYVKEESKGLTTKLTKTETQPTCTKPGKITYTSKSTGKVVYEEVTAPRLGHELSGEYVYNDEYSHVQYCIRFGQDGCSNRQWQQHTAGEPKTENAVGPTCTEAGSHDEVVYCTVCDGELSRTNVTDDPATDHDWGDWEKQDNGTFKRVCANDASHVDIWDPADHDGAAPDHSCNTDGMVEHKDATCTEDGVVGGMYCTFCGKGKEAAEEVIETTDHTAAEERKDAVEATCTQKGYTGDLVCKNCGEVLKKGMETAMKTHTYGPWSDSANKHCVGSTFDRTHTCTACGHEETEKGLAGSRTHVLKDIVITSMVWNEGTTFDHFNGATATVECQHCDFTETLTYTSAGSNTFRATACGQQSTRTYNVQVRVTAPGNTKQFNLGKQVSGQYYSEPLEHVYDEQPVWTWNDDFGGAVRAEALFTCSRNRTSCVHREYVYALENLGNLSADVTDPATCVNGGKITYTAAVEFEGKTYTDTHVVEVPATSHQLTYYAAVEATCTANGNIEYWTCDVCGQYFDDAEGTNRIPATSVVIPTAGHTAGNPVRENEVPTSCEVPGSYDSVVYCTECDEELNREKKDIPTTGHIFTDYVSNNDAACGQDGTKTARCNHGCGKTDTIIDEGSALSHAWGEWTITTAPTETAAGEATRVCGNDDTHIETEVLPALKDVATADGWRKVATEHVDATCEADGKDVYRNRDLDLSVTVILPALGHDWGEWTVTTEPTADAEGAAERTCGTCGKVETKVLPALGGDGGDVTDPEWTYEVTLEPGCTTEGEGTYTYTDGTSLTVTIPATGHAWGAWIVAYEPSYTAQGAEIRTCASCGATETRAIAALELPEGGFGDTGETEIEVEIEDEETPLADMPFSLNPEDELTRGHLMYVLHWFEGSPEAEISTFIDVAFEAYYSTAIGWAEDGNIARGTPDNKFLPDVTVTRGQMEIFLTRYVEYLGLDMEVILIGEDSDLMYWAEAEIILNEFFANLPVEA